MATQQDLDNAAVDALALTRFMTADAGSSNYNSAGIAVGTLADRVGDLSAQTAEFETVGALRGDPVARPEGSILKALRERAAYRVVGAAEWADLITTGGSRLRHIEGPYVIVLTGQSNAAGSNPDGPNPASPLVRTWDPVIGAWGGSDRTATPWSRANPDGSGGNNNYALARAHRVADDTGRPVFVIFDARGGAPIEDWVANGVSSTRYASLKAKVDAAFASEPLASAGVTVVDEIIMAQGEANFADDFATHRDNLKIFNAQIRAESWCTDHTPVYHMAPSDLHDRYEWRGALQYLCSHVDNRNVFVPSNGLKTEYSETGSGDYTHFLGESLWQAGYYRIADATLTETAPQIFYNRGSGPLSPSDLTALCTFDTLVSRDSWTSSTPADGPAANGAISWGYQCYADGNYTVATGYECATGNLANYGIVAGRAVVADDTSDYFAGFGYQNTLSARYTLATGRGHTVADEGATAVGMFSEYVAAEADPIVFQAGAGTSSSNRKNVLTIRKSGRIEAKNLPVHPDNVTALSGGLSAGDVYQTSGGDLKIVI
ncbi:hypothetical protein AADZ90_015390 [Aestuariibius sp. 2305UL40-4]|uniref:hypothetical protein n=1 Tax=Aestuariibius violaceus TaxID=3234132 RepID=UPI00345E0D18